jgi:hypothetical protein
LKPRRPEKPNIPAMTEHYKRENRVAALVIIKNPTAYPKGSVNEIWARKVLGEDDDAPRP